VKVAVIVGTRPEAIKLAPVILALRADARFSPRVCVTGQHRQMLDQALADFRIVPDDDLNLMRPGQTLAGLTARAIEALDEYFQRQRPDVVLVQGDTTTVFCATLAAFYHRIPVGHVEAGLRTGDLMAPWPEEANRSLTARLAALHFAPTESAKANLLREGIDPARVWVTGNTVIDALQLAVNRVRAEPPVVAGVPPALQPSGARPRYVLITGHRRENFGDGFESICRAIVELADRHPDVHFIYPVHLNPNVREPVNRLLQPAAGRNRTNIHLIEPVPYLPFVALLDGSAVVLTDSGGVQEEAPSLGKPVLVMRDKTERPEAVEAGLVQLVGTDFDRIVQGVTDALAGRSPAQRPAAAAGGLHPSPYGDGRAAARIVELCAAGSWHRRA
jgi:UDP-N-acetylglucosamine 2-epimerase (non-hydrolysing)